MRLSHQLRWLYWRVFQPTTLGSRCLVIRDGNVLLVKHSYENWWYMPGGGLMKGESFIDAARREVFEECSVHVTDLELFNVYRNAAEGKNDHVALFITRNYEGVPSADSDEIAEIGSFPIDSLPPGTSPATLRRIAEFRGGERAHIW